VTGAGSTRAPAPDDAAASGSEWFENRDGALGIVRAMVIVTATAELA